MVKRKLKKPVIYALYGIAGMILITCIYLVEKALSDAMFKPPNEDYEYVSDIIIEDDVPVVNVKAVILRPYNVEKADVIKNFYDYKGEAKDQEKALILFENTYLQNTGVIYGGKDPFDVVSILDGTVIEVKEDNLFGKIVEVKHGNNMISIYQSLSEVSVKKDDVIRQGDVIGKSGTSNMFKDINNHLYFELIYKGQNVNPEEYYDKKVEEL